MESVPHVQRDSHVARSDLKGGTVSFTINCFTSFSFFKYRIARVPSLNCIWEMTTTVDTSGRYLKKNISNTMSFHFLLNSFHQFNQWPFQDPKMEVPIICKAYFLGLCKGIYTQNMAKHMVLTYLHFRILEFPLIQYIFFRSLKSNPTWTPLP